MRGECLDGELQFEIDTENPKLHCLKRRKQGGSPGFAACFFHILLPHKVRIGVETWSYPCQQPGNYLITSLQHIL
jgi:hypothetical protein